MARVKRYQQGQLASSRVGAPPLDTSGSMIASSILQSTAALSSSIIQGEGMRQQQAAHAAASAFTNVGQQLDHQRNLEYAETRRTQLHLQAVAEAAEKQRQTELTQSMVANHYIPLSNLLNKHESVIRDQQAKGNPAATGEVYGKTAPDVVRGYIESQPELINNPKAATDLFQLSSNHIVQTQAGLTKSGAAQEIDNQRDMTLSNAESIVKASGVDSGPGLNPLSGEAIVKTLAQLNSMQPNFDRYIRNPSVAMEKHKTDAFVKWANRNIDVGDPRLVRELLKPGADGIAPVSKFVQLDADTIKKLNTNVEAAFVAADRKVIDGLKVRTIDFRTALQTIQAQDLSDPEVAAGQLKIAQTLLESAIKLPSSIQSLSGELIPNTTRESNVDVASETVRAIRAAIKTTERDNKAEATQERMLTNQEREIAQRAATDAKNLRNAEHTAKMQSPEAISALAEVSRAFGELPSAQKLAKGQANGYTLTQLAETQNILARSAPYMRAADGKISPDYITKVALIQNLTKIASDKINKQYTPETEQAKQTATFLQSLSTGSNTALKALLPHAAGHLDTQANERHSDIAEKYKAKYGVYPTEKSMPIMQNHVAGEQTKAIATNTAAIPPKPAAPAKAIPASIPVKKGQRTMVPPPPPMPMGGKVTRAQLQTMGYEVVD